MILFKGINGKVTKEREKGGREAKKKEKEELLKGHTTKTIMYISKAKKGNERESGVRER